MSLRPTRTLLAFATSACALLVFGTAAALAQYSTPVGTGAAKPKTLRATAVLEWTGSLEKPSASRLMPIAVWDGEHYQPAGLYLAHPAPLAFETGTQYQLQRSGEPAGLFDVRAAGQVSGAWIGLGKFQPQAAPPPPPKLKPSKRLPVASGSKAEGSEKTSGKGDDRPTLHTKNDDSAPAPSDPQDSKGSTSTTGSSGSGSGSSAGAGSKPSSGDDSDAPTLHRRTPDAGDTGTSSPPAASKPNAPASTPSSTPPSTQAPAPDAGSSTSTSSDPDQPTLHRRSESTDPASPGTSTSADASKAPASETDRPTLHRPADPKAADPDSDRPTLHRAHTESAAATSIDPDRPRLRYGRGEEGEGAVLPVRLTGMPPSMQQMVAVSDAATGEERPYQYHWPAPEDAAKMQAALAALAAQAVAKPVGATAPGTARPKTQFGPASRSSARRARPSAANASAPAIALVDERFAAYELSFSGGATLVYTAHTAGEGAQRVYVTLIAQPDFSGKPQVLFQQVTRGDRLDETPAMQLVDALDTDNDQRAELIFQLNGALTVPSAAEAPEAAAGPQPEDTGSSATAASSAASRSAAAAANASAASVQRVNAAAVPEREFAIYRVANGKAFQVFTTGPLP